MQWELQHKNGPFWKSLTFRKAGSEFMSEVCNRRIRRNINVSGGSSLSECPISRSNRGKGQLRLIIFNEFSVRSDFLVRKR